MTQYKLVPVKSTPAMGLECDQKFEVPCGYENTDVYPEMCQEIYDFMVANVQSPFQVVDIDPAVVTSKPAKLPDMTNLERFLADRTYDRWLLEQCLDGKMEQYQNEISIRLGRTP